MTKGWIQAIKGFYLASSGSLGHTRSRHGEGEDSPGCGLSSWSLHSAGLGQHSSQTPLPSSPAVATPSRCHCQCCCPGIRGHLPCTHYQGCQKNQMAGGISIETCLGPVWSGLLGLVDGMGPQEVREWDHGVVISTGLRPWGRATIHSLHILATGTRSRGRNMLGVDCSSAPGPALQPLHNPGPDHSPILSGQAHPARGVPGQSPWNLGPRAKPFRKFW